MTFRKAAATATRILAGAAMALALGVPACYAAEAAEPDRGDVWKFGSEIDLLPYATKGYYGSVFAGRNGWRLRGVAARSTVPSFLVTDGFREKRTDAYAFLMDHFFGSKGREWQGFWIGGGGEYWRTRIRTEESPEFARYNNFVLTIGGGYAWKLSRHFYVNPWAGGHFVTAGERKIQVSGKTYEQPVFTPEFSVKFGFTF
jgi:hypothetical protein